MKARPDVVARPWERRIDIFFSECMVDLLMTIIIIILITSILPKLKAIQARPARMKPSAPAPGFEATVDWVGAGGLFSLFFCFFFTSLSPHLPVGLVDDDKSEKPEKVADPKNPLRLRGSKANDAGVGDKSLVVHVVAVEEIRQVGHASHWVVFNKIAKIDDSLGRKTFSSFRLF